MDFLITDALLAEALDEATDQARNSERLLVLESDDQLDISLFIDESVLHALREQDPYTCLDRDNLEPFMIALEGVSHFNYVVWNAERRRQITQLELELQAEVDKFVTAMIRLDEQGADVDAGAGIATWDGARDDGQPAVAGMYVFRQDGGSGATGRVLLLR